MLPAYSVIFPAYNEEETITRAVDETVKVFLALQQPFEIIVVDDGSLDATALIVESRTQIVSQLRLVRHATNLGKGGAVKTGVANARGNILLFLDCDLSTHPSQFLSFLPFLEEADVLIGSRRVEGARIDLSQPFYRVFLGRMFNAFIRVYLEIPFLDTQCGFKVFTREAAQTIFPTLQSQGWVFDVEILTRALQAGLRILELPVTWRHGHESRVRLRDAIQILHELRRMKRRLKMENNKQ